MENETVIAKSLFSEAAKEVMWVTNEIHDMLDSLIEEAIKIQDSSISEAVCYSARTIRAKLRNINNINIEKLFGTSRITSYGSL